MLLLCSISGNQSWIEHILAPSKPCADTDSIPIQPVVVLHDYHILFFLATQIPLETFMSSSPSTSACGYARIKSICLEARPCMIARVDSSLTAAHITTGVYISL